MRYSIRFLLIITTIVALLALCATHLTQTTYFISCAIIPASLALTFRHFQNTEHGASSLIALGAAILTGSSMLAYGSYDQTFNNDASGFLVGDGWNSVAASAFVGAIAGFFAGSPLSWYIFGIWRDRQLKHKHSTLTRRITM